jgi:hypothetical protein
LPHDQDTSSHEREAGKPPAEGQALPAHEMFMRKRPLSMQ